MKLQYIKLTLATVWALAAIVGALTAGVGSSGGWITAAALGLLPPLAMWRLWNDPPQTMSESIQQARR
ncbi:MAG: hypothetical protein KJ061_14745 [Vicinamibacteraceae bacterium]|nr:hypothetical protein [Vicinamibacteraceae bacterium]